MAKISTKGITPKKRLFHDVSIKVYETTSPLKSITFWPENNRTEFTFELLERQENKPLKEIPLEDIVRFVAGKPQHKLDELAQSIRLNGVRVPLIVLDDGTLLDGNRRYFACQLLRLRYEAQKKPLPGILTKVPVWIIKEKDIDKTLRLKILAEANFVEDLKVPWPLDAKARAVKSFYDECIGPRKLDHDRAVAEIREVFAISAGRVQDYLDTMKLAEDFVNAAKTEDDRFARRQIIESSFVYFWEFRNKAIKGSSRLDPTTELPEVQTMFYQLMLKQEGFANIKEIEPFIRARRDKTSWMMLTQSNGTKLPQVVAMMNEKKALRKAEDKLQVFLSWIEEVNAEEFSDIALMHLRAINKIAEKIIKGRRGK